MKEPIAIVGLGCRLPGGANSPQEYWNLLRSGRDAIVEIPPDRWNADAYYSPNAKAPGKTVSRWGGFIDAIQMFDTRFFGISPREAVHMDPQQRILLECVWQALEDGGQVPEQLAGSPVGVFVGISGMDYSNLIRMDLHSVDGHTGTGSALSIAANRISYVLDLKGPSLVVDTACSSSLMAVHLACRSIWDGESGMALAGGVNAMLVPDVTITLGKGGMLSPDGRCKSFDAAGNGYVRGEGAGIAVLKPLAKALADNDPVYALILSTTANQDGHTPGMPVPDAASQKAMLLQSCEKAGVSPGQIQYLEAHGTGTPVGDPIEINAQGEILAKDRPSGDYCYIGSVKTNIGHLESASGIASLIKVALALKHKEIPPNLHFTRPNPNIRFEEYRLRVPQSLVPWPQRPEPALAAVNSFGFGGTNANVILREAPRSLDVENAGRESGEAGSFCLPLSARSAEALNDYAKKYIEVFSAGDPGSRSSLNDVCYTASERRSHHDYRLSVVGESFQEMKSGLEAFLGKEKHPGLSSGKKVRRDSPKIAFVFSGQGPQWWGMGRRLLEREPVFQNTIKRCDEMFSAHADWSLWEELTADETRSRIHETHITQPALFSLQIALAELWQSWGIKPDAVIGHSVGEAAAACVAGIYSLEEAVRIIFHRGRLLHQIYGKGKMAVVGLPEQEAVDLIGNCKGRVSLAAVNSPKSVTLSGDAQTLEKLIQPLQQREVFCRYLKVHYAFHSSQVDSIQKSLLHSLNAIACQPGSIPFYSTVRGDREAGENLLADYWWENVRKPVLFYKAASQLIEDGFSTFLEIGPHPVLGANISESFSRLKRSGKVLPSLKHKEDDRRVMLESLGDLYCQGHSVNWGGLFPNGGHCVSLPYYPWQKERYWHEREEKGCDQFASSVHPFLGRKVESASHTWQSRVDKRELTYLGEHVVKGVLIFPGAAFVETALAVSKAVYEESSCVLRSVEFHNPLYLPRNRGVKTQTTFDSSDASFKFHSLSDHGNETWTLHATGFVDRVNPAKNAASVDVNEIKKRCSEEVPAGELYQTFKRMGLEYGPAFQGIESAWRGDQEALGLLKGPQALGLMTEKYQFHPAILDAGFQVSALMVIHAESLRKKLFLPVSVDRVQFHGSASGPLWVHVRAVKFKSIQAVVDLKIFDATGRVCIECRGLHFRALDQSRQVDLQNPENWLYEWRWEPCKTGGRKKENHSAAFLPLPGEILADLKKDRDQLFHTLRRQDYYDDLEPRLNGLGADYIIDAFKQLGVDLKSLRPFSTDELIERFKLHPKHVSYVESCLWVLKKEKVLEKQGPLWAVIAADRAVMDPQAVWRSLVRQFPAFVTELSLLKMTGETLSAILKGEIDGLHKVLPGGESLWERLQGASSSRVYQLLVQRAVSGIADCLPEQGKIRVLEIGGSAGGIKTAALLKRLPSAKVEYVFTESSEDKLDKARQKFREFAFVEYQTLNFGSAPADQGFEPHSFDLVLGSDFSLDPGKKQKALQAIGDLMARNGFCIQLEWSRIPAWLGMILGSGEFDAGNEAVSTVSWMGGSGSAGALADSGFKNLSRLGDRDPVEESLQALMLAQGHEIAVEKVTERKNLSRPESRGGWVLFADGKGVGRKLAETLRSLGETCFLITPGPAFKRVDDWQAEVRRESLADLGDLLDLLQGQTPSIRGIVHLWNLDFPGGVEYSLDSLKQAEISGCLNVIQLVNELASASWAKPPRLFLVTRGGQNVWLEEKHIAVAQAPVWGVGRVIQSEQSQLRCRMVDLDPEDASADVNALVEELFRNDAEEEVAFRGDRRFVHRLVRSKAKECSIDNLAGEKKAQPFVLDIGTPGILENFKLRSVRRPPPGAGELEIQVRAAGLNFRDVMIAMGLLPGELEGVDHTWETLGLECSGVVTAVGSHVQDFKAGDEVVALSGGGCFGSHTLAPDFAVAHKPERISLEDAATLPVTFLTAYYMLHSAGRLQKGERILIHAASGGVGMAAVEIAQLAGAEVFATAGTEEKRGFLRGLGVKHVMDSRSLAFADEIMELTHGEGVDLILNSLAGQFIFKSVALLKPFGRFLEIGKRDIYENNKMGLRPFLKGISFITMVDIKQGFESFKEEFSSIYLKIMRHMEEGSLHPLPHKVFPVSDAQGAFRAMAQARHIGKVVLSLEEPGLKISQDLELPIAFDFDSTYLITGGLGGFGLEAAKWMVARGARHLALMGRSGVSSHEAHEAIDIMQQAGAKVRVIQGDVSSAEDVGRTLRQIDASMPPLKGVLHGAMVLDDGFLIHLTPQRLSRVMAPKAHGAWNLHLETRDRPLDFFILFSSVANVMGNPGQANYVAANAFLESLAHYRRAQGLCGQVIHWGPLAEVGIAARQDLNQRLENQGLQSLTPKQAVEMLGRMMQQNPVAVGVFPVEWKKLLSLSRSGSAPVKFSHILGELSGMDSGSEAELDGEEAIRPKLLGMPAEERAPFLAEHLKKSIARVLGLAPAKLETDRSLGEMGLDSLMAMELIVRIESDLEITVPVVRFLGGPSIDQMVPWLLEEIKKREDGSEAEEEASGSWGLDGTSDRRERENQAETP